MIATPSTPTPSRRRLRRPLAALAVVSLVGLAAAACGSSSSSKAAGGGGGSTAGSTAAAATSAPAATDAATSAAGSGSDASSCMTWATQTVADAQSSGAAITVPKLDSPASTVAKTDAYFVAPINAVAAFVIQRDAFADAGKEAGVGTHSIDSGLSATTQNAAIQQAVNAKASFIVIDGIDTANVTPGLKAALSAKIPVVSLYEAPSTDTAKQAVVSAITPSGDPYAKFEVALALKQTNCSTDIGLIYSKAYSLEVSILAGLNKYLPQECPTCKVVTAEYDPSTATTSAAPQAAAFVQANPNMKAVILGDGTLYASVTPKITSIDSKILIMGNGADANSTKFLDDPSSGMGGVAETGEVGFFSWTAFDAGLRALQPAKTTSSSFDASSLLPVTLLTKDHDPAHPFPSWTGYQDTFGTAWK